MERKITPWHPGARDPETGPNDFHTMTILPRYLWNRCTVGEKALLIKIRDWYAWGGRWPTALSWWQVMQRQEWEEKFSHQNLSVMDKYIRAQWLAHNTPYCASVDAYRTIVQKRGKELPFWEENAY